jgi:AcrR family transcriptional regulator
MRSSSSGTEAMPRRQSIVDTAPARPARRAQADRTAGTRAALEQATIDLLIERGWAAVTAIEVCNRAGVSRGAFHHHYTSLPQLLADALKRLYAEMRDEDRPPAADLGRLIDATWRHISSPRFKAVLEAWLAMANDSSLDSEIGPVVAEFSNLVSPANATTPTLADESDRALYLMARETLLGLALGRATNRGRPLGHEQTVLTQLRRIADHGIQAR